MEDSEAFAADEAHQYVDQQRGGDCRGGQFYADVFKAALFEPQYKQKEQGQPPMASVAMLHAARIALPKNMKNAKPSFKNRSAVSARG